MSRVLDLLLLRAESRHRRAVVGGVLGVLALGLIHALAVRPLALGSRGAEEASARAAELGTLTAEIDGLGRHLESFEETVTTTLEPALEELIDGLDDDLARLGAARNDLVLFFADPEVLPGPAAGAALRDLFPFDLDDPNRLLALAEARGRSETLDALAPLVDEFVVRPRFAELNRVWVSQALPLVETQLETLAGAIPTLRGRAAGLAKILGEQSQEERWQDLARDVGTLGRAARELLILPPERPRWWALTVGESSNLAEATDLAVDTVSEAAVDRRTGTPDGSSPAAQDAADVSLGLSAAMDEQLRAPVALDRLNLDLGRLVASRAALAAGLDVWRRDLMASAPRSLVSRFLSSVALSPSQALAAFPALLGLALACLAFWAARQFRELGMVAERRLARGDVNELRALLLLRARWGLTPGRASAAWAGEVWRHGMVALVGLAWLATAARTAAGPSGPAWESAALGAAALLAVVIYRLVMGRAIWRRLAPAETSVGTAAWREEMTTGVAGLREDDGAGEEDLEGHQLLR